MRTENGVVTLIVGELFVPQLMAAICDVYNGDCDGGTNRRWDGAYREEDLRLYQSKIEVSNDTARQDLPAA